MIGFRGPKNEFFSGHLAIFPKNDLKIAHFCGFYCFLNKNVPKISFPMLKSTSQCKISTFYHMAYGKKDLDLLDILYLACFYVSLIYKFMHILKNGANCFVLAVGSASDRSNVKCSAIF